MSNGDLEALRARVARHTDNARTRPLVELGLALANQYWRVGPGTPAARPYLDEAIQALDEAYGHLEQGEFLRGHLASLLGWLIGSRYVAHGNHAPDREKGIRLLEEGLAWPQLPQVQQVLGHLVLGQLLLSRLTGRMLSEGLQVIGAGFSADETANADQAVECFRHVTEGSAISPEITSLAETLLGVAEAMQSLARGLGGGLAGLDLSRMLQLFTNLQNLQQQAAGRPQAGIGFVPNIFDFDVNEIATADPLERPVAVVDGLMPAARVAARSALKPVEQVPATSLRTALLLKLPGTDFAAILPMLAEDAALPEVGTVDELTALASSLAEAPGTIGTDRLLLAVALYLRSAVEGSGGWDDDADDLRAAGDNLIAAADALLSERADTVAVAVRLAARLDERRPRLGVRTRLSQRFGPVTEALRKVGADGLVYPTPGQMLMLSAQTGQFEVATLGSRLPARIVVAGDGPIPDEPTISHVTSGAQVVELANRIRRPINEAVVFVANPRRDREQATIDALLLRRSFYPQSTGLGETVESIDGTGTPAEVRARLDDASLLHLGCGVSVDGGLELAGHGVLDPAEIANGLSTQAGGLAVLPPTTTGRMALTEALLTSRFVGVIGFRNPVPARVASLIYFLLYTNLVNGGRHPASAVSAVRRWMADPERKPPEFLPTWYEAMARDLADSALGGALIYHGV